MEIYFNRKLDKILNKHKEIVREYGVENAKKIEQRLGELRAAENLEQIPAFPPTRRHELEGNLKGKFTIDIKQPWRIIFEPYHDPVPVKEDGGIDLSKVTKIFILDVRDYH